jgi:hypothetical protein
MRSWTARFVKFHDHVLRLEPATPRLASWTQRLAMCRKNPVARKNSQVEELSQQHLLCLTMVEHKGTTAIAIAEKSIDHGSEWDGSRWKVCHRLSLQRVEVLGCISRDCSCGPQKILGRWPWAPSAQKEWNGGSRRCPLKTILTELCVEVAMLCRGSTTDRVCLSHFLQEPCGSFWKFLVICSL